jgi:hypothetical protein
VLPWDYVFWGWRHKNFSEIAAVRQLLDQIVTAGAGHCPDEPLTIILQLMCRTVNYWSESGDPLFGWLPTAVFP